MDSKKGKKGFYIALFVSVFSILAITYTINSVKNISEKMASINKAKNSLEVSDDMKISNDLSSNYELKEKKNEKKVIVKENKKQIHKEEKEVKETIVINDINKTIGKLTFNEEVGLNWPLQGEIIKNYSMDKLLYFPTLGIFKVNPGIFISSKEGMDVKAAHKGVVTKIGEDEEYGKYIEIAIGDEYILYYAQVDNIKVKKGDNIDEGDIIAQVAKVTSYYKKEGTHLFFKVMQNNENVDPMLLLR